MKKVILIFSVALVIVVVLVIQQYVGTNAVPAITIPDEESPGEVAPDHKNTSYLIDGRVVVLNDGFAEAELAPGSASKVVTRYFGNELVTDLDGDGDEDIAFILTQIMGGSGTFYYAVAALQTETGYIGSDGYLLGDRVAPQSTNMSQNPRHKNVVVFNYADRSSGEPMTAQPTIGKSVYLKIVPENNQWAVVEPNPESL